MHETRAQQRMILQNRDNLFHIGFGIKQANNVGITPQAGFARKWLEDRRVMRVLEGDGDRTGLHQRIAQLFGVCTSCIQF